MNAMDPNSILSVNEYAALTWTFAAVAIVTTVLRLGVRAYLVKFIGLDDYLIFFGQVAAIAVTALSHWHIDVVWNLYDTAAEAGTVGLYVPENISKGDVVYRSGLIADCSYLLALPLIKCSILAFYRRIAPMARQHYVLYVLAFIIIAQGLTIMLLGIFSVDPPSAWWNFFTSAYRLRFQHKHFQTINSSFQVLFDLVILALPIRIIFRTNFRRRDRVGLMVIYALSFLSLAATITRLVKVAQFVQSTDVVDQMVRRLDYTYWAIIEIMTAIMCANLPAMPSLVRHVSRGPFKAFRVLPGSREHSGRSEDTKHPRFSLRKWVDRSINSLYNASDGSRKREGNRYSVSQMDLTGKRVITTNETLEFDMVPRTNVPDGIFRHSPQETNDDVSIMRDFLTTEPSRPSAEQVATVVQKDDVFEYPKEGTIHVTREIDVESNMA